MNAELVCACQWTALSRWHCHGIDIPCNARKISCSVWPYRADMAVRGVRFIGIAMATVPMSMDVGIVSSVSQVRARVTSTEVTSK